MQNMPTTELSIYTYISDSEFIQRIATSEVWMFEWQDKFWIKLHDLKKEYTFATSLFVQSERTFSNEFLHEPIL